MTILIPLVLILVVLVLVISPFFKRAPESGNGRRAADETLEREEILLAERLDVEYDYQMGKLTYDEYRRLTDQWEEDIRKLDDEHGHSGFLERLERELQERLQALEGRDVRPSSRASGPKEGSDVDRPVDSTRGKPHQAKTR